MDWFFKGVFIKDVIFILQLFRGVFTEAFGVSL